MWRNFLNGERSWWLLSNDKCLRSATARTLWKKGESSAPSVFHAFLGAICERALNLYVCRGGALWLAYHRTQTQSATQWECLFNPSTDSYYSYDTRTRQKCFIRTGYSFQPSIRLNSSERCLMVPSQAFLSKSLSRTFSFTIPGWWNDLPTPIRNAGSLSIFKQQLKTHLFQHYLTSS